MPDTLKVETTDYLYTLDSELWTIIIGNYMTSYKINYSAVVSVIVSFFPAQIF